MSVPRHGGRARIGKSQGERCGRGWAQAAPDTQFAPLGGRSLPLGGPCPPAERSDNLDAGRIFYQLTSGELYWGRTVARPPTLTLPVDELRPWPKLTPEEPMQH